MAGVSYSSMSIPNELEIVSKQCSIFILDAYHNFLNPEAWWFVYKKIYAFDEPLWILVNMNSEHEHK